MTSLTSRSLAHGALCKIGILHKHISINDILIKCSPPRSLIENALKEDEVRAAANSNGLSNPDQKEDLGEESVIRSGSFGEEDRKPSHTRGRLLSSILEKLSDDSSARSLVVTVREGILVNFECSDFTMAFRRNNSFNYAIGTNSDVYHIMFVSIWYF